MTKWMISDVIAFHLCLPCKGDMENTFASIEIRNSASIKTHLAAMTLKQELINIIATIIRAAPKKAALLLEGGLPQMPVIYLREGLL